MKIVGHIILLFLIIPAISFSQNISGVVKDSSTNKPLAGANITLGSMGTVTDENGNFTISKYHKNNPIRISSVGYITKTIPLGSTQNGNIVLLILLTKENFQIEEVFISATRTENRIGQIPGRINLITADRLSMFTSQNIDEKLQFLSGVQVSRSFGIFSTKSSVTMRGLSGNEQARTLVLLDGVPVNKADGGSVNWNLISTAEVERVEVVKGPGSALYGGNAMGGVINIITTRPKNALQGALDLFYSTYNTKGLRLNLGGTFLEKANKGFFWSSNSYYCNSDGYITQSEADQKANPFIVKSNVDEKAFNLKTGFYNRNKLNAVVDFSLYDGIRGTGEKVYQPNGNQTEYLTYQVRTTLSGSLENIHWNASLFLLNENYKKVNEWYKDDYTWYNVTSIRRDMGLLSGVTYKISNHSITTGFDVRNGQVNASDIYYTSTDQVDNNGTINFYGLYLQDEVLLPKSFKLLVGIRYDLARFYNGSFIIYAPSAETNFLSQYQFRGLPDEQWGAFSPRISLQYKPSEKFRIYNSYSRGFRPSVLDDLCRTGRVRGGMKVANPNLEPEYLDNFELGADVIVDRKIKLGGSTYFSKGKDFLYYVSTGDSIDMGFGPRPIMIRTNISNVRIYGGEFDFSYIISPKISVFGNYAYTNAKIVSYKPLDSNDPTNLKGKFLTDVPKNSFAFGTFLQSDILNAGLTFKYCGAMYVNDQNIYDEIVLSNQYPAWFTFDLKLSREVFDHIIASLNIQNILDKKIYDSKGAVGPGRFITFNIGLKI